MRTLLILLLISNAVTAQTWNSDLDEALREAKKTSKHVLLYFSVPETCGRCEVLENNIWASEAFKNYAETRFVFAKPEFAVTAAMETKANNLLIVEKYNKDGFFPLVVILDPNSKVIGKPGIYNDETPMEYLKLLEAILQKQ